MGRRSMRDGSAIITEDTVRQESSPRYESVDRTRLRGGEIRVAA